VRLHRGYEAVTVLMVAGDQGTADLPGQLWGVRRGIGGRGMGVGGAVGL